MEGDWGYVLSCTFRFAILTASAHFVQIAVVNALLERRRSLRGISCYMAIKALGLVIAFYMISKYRKAIQSEQSFLMMQKELMESHYQKVQEQISQIENSREAVSVKMCSVVEYCSGVYGGGNDSGNHKEDNRENNSGLAKGREQASAYLQSLAAEYKVPIKIWERGRAGKSAFIFQR